MQKVVSTSENLFCKFCNLVGHEEKYCRAYQLLKEKTVDTYLMKNEGLTQAELVQASYQVAQFPPNQYQNKYEPQYAPQYSYTQQNHYQQNQYPPKHPHTQGRGG